MNANIRKIYNDVDNLNMPFYGQYRHSFTKYTTKPYIWYYGVPLDNSMNYVPECVKDNRTIIRTNRCDKYISSHVPMNGMGHITGMYSGELPLEKLKGHDPMRDNHQQWYNAC